MSRYLIDTNILSEPLKPEPNPKLIAKMQRHTDEIAIAAITWHEIRFGCDLLPPSRRRKHIEAYLKNVQETFPILPYDTEAATWHAAERARLKNQPPPFQDGQIAAIAVIKQLILVTNNVSDFLNFQELEIENWFEL